MKEISEKKRCKHILSLERVFVVSLLIFFFLKESFKTSKKVYKQKIIPKLKKKHFPSQKNLSQKKKETMVF